MKEYLELLRYTSLFKNMETAALIELLKSTGAYIEDYNFGETILYTGSITGKFGIVLEGSVQIMKEDFQGNRALLVKLKPGELFAEAFACAKMPLTVTAEAAQNTKILWMNYEMLKSYGTGVSECCSLIMENLTGILAGKNIFLTGRIEHLSKRTLREKILSYLSEQAVRSGGRSFTIPFNRQELADYLASDRSAVSFVLSRLQKEGKIKFYKNKFTLLN